MKFISYHQDPWRTAGGEDGPQPHPPIAPHSLLTLEQWHAVRETWPAGVPVGVILPNDSDIETLAAGKRLIPTPSGGAGCRQFGTAVDGWLFSWKAS